MPFSTTRNEMPRLPAGGSVLATTIMTSASRPFVMSVLLPLRMYSLPLRRAVVVIASRSLPARVRSRLWLRFVARAHRCQPVGVQLRTGAAKAGRDQIIESDSAHGHSVGASAEYLVSHDCAESKVVDATAAKAFRNVEPEESLPSGCLVKVSGDGLLRLPGCEIGENLTLGEWPS